VKRLSGYSLSVLRKQNGRWVIARDANLVTPERAVHAAVPVFQVTSVARSITWYREILGFSADPVGPADDPVFAILRRDGVELMLQKGQAKPVQGWSAYIRVADVAALRDAALAKEPGVDPIVTREYGCLECTLPDPDGYVLAIGQCG
jgi:hypothetical protein